MAQRLACRAHNPEVDGSNPSAAILSSYSKLKIIKPFNFDGPGSILGEAKTFLGGGKNNDDSIICEFVHKKKFVFFTNWPG